MREAEANRAPRPPGEWRTRREFLRRGLSAGAAAALWPVVGGVSGLRRAPLAHAVIQVHLDGGLSHLDTFDPKPRARSEVRGPFRAIRTSLDGIEFSELCPGLARVADRLCVLRSVSHAEFAHERASARMLTAHDPGSAVGLPSFGAVVSHRLAPRRGVPTYACIPSQGHPDLGAGFLSEVHGPHGAAGGESRGACEDSGRYGRTSIGRRLSRARQLVERGARYVTVLERGWDQHRAIASELRSRMPPLDRALAALITDLDERGTLARTLVLLTTEFGRSPRMNRDGGRDHWPRVFTVLAAGGGLKRGAVLGASCQDGAEPLAELVSPADLAATLYSRLGIEPTTVLRRPSGDAFAVAPGGRVLHELLA